MGRHRAPSKAAYTATDLIADIAEEDAQLASEPTSVPVELVMEDDFPTGRLGVVPVHVRYLSDDEARANAADALFTTGGIKVARPVDPPTVMMAALPPLPPVFPVAVETPQDVQEPLDRPGQARGAHRASEPATDVSVTLDRATRHLRSVS